MQPNETLKVGMVTVLVVVVIFGGIFALQGVQMHKDLMGEEMKYHELQKEYYSVSKSVRDAAPTDSALNMQLVEIKNYPSQLMMMKLVGLGHILTGIFILLFGILMALIMMPIKLAVVMKSQEKPRTTKPRKRK